MKKVKIQIVEDELIIANDIAELLEENDYTVTDICGSKEEAIAAFKKDKPDLVLMDINLQNTFNATNNDGIEAAKIIQSLQEIPIIYVSAFQRREALATRPANYLTKPIREQDLLNAIELALMPTKETIIYPKKDFFFIKNGYAYKKMYYRDLLYVQAAGVYIDVYTIHQKKPHNFVMKLAEFDKKYPHPLFVRANRSYVINMDSIDTIDGHIITINGKSIKVTQNKERIMQYLLE